MTANPEVMVIQITVTTELSTIRPEGGLESENGSWLR